MATHYPNLEVKTANPAYVPPATVKQSKDTVNHPAHYNVGAIEVIDAIESWQLNFSRGSAIKYIARAGHKNDEIEDLKKAAWYINREIQRLTKLKE